MAEQMIVVENVSKRYRIGVKEQMDDSIGGALVSIIKAPAKNLKKLRDLSNFDKEDGPDVFWALKNISFTLNKGDVMGIVGKNGSGKSTLLKLLSRITPPTTGKISINGRVSSLLEVGTGFHDELTGRENVYLNGTILGMKRKEIDEKFDEIIAFSGVEKFIDTPVKRYSSGMKVRLAFAVAAHLEPEVLIIDEVLAVGDSEFQKKCLGKIGDLSSHGRTVLFVSHNMSAVKSLCNKCLFLNNGELIEQGDPASIVHHYLMRSGSNLKREIDNNDPQYKNEYLHLESIETITALQDGKIVINEPITFKVVGFNKFEGGRYNIVMYFIAEEGECAFTAYSDIKEMPYGRFEAYCNIPAHTFNDMNYTINMLVNYDGNTSPLIHIANAIAFNVIEPQREVGWMGVIAGLVRPKIDWEFVSKG